MVQLEKKMKDNDVKRQATYLEEIAKTRRLQLNMKLRADDARHELHHREEQIANLKTELLTYNKQVDAVKNLVTTPHDEPPSPNDEMTPNKTRRSKKAPPIPPRSVEVIWTGCF